KRFRHVHFQLIRMDERPAGLVKFAQLQQRFTEAVKRYSAPRLILSFEAKFFLGLVPLLRASVKFAELQVQLRRLRTQSQGFAKLPLGGWDISQRGIILRHHLMGPRRIRKASFERVENLFGKKTGGTAVVVKQVRIIWTFRQS